MSTISTSYRRPSFKKVILNAGDATSGIVNIVVTNVPVVSGNVVFTYDWKSSAGTVKDRAGQIATYNSVSGIITIEKGTTTFVTADIINLVTTFA
jgi:hypothetical protein